MNSKYRDNRIRTFFFVAVTFFCLRVFEKDICGSVNYSYASDLTNIEAIFQPELPKEFQPYKSSLPLKQRNAYVSFNLENTIKYRKKLFLSISNISNKYIKNQNKYTLSFHHLVSILQKNNTWHQSSDDDSLPNDCC